MGRRTRASVVRAMGVAVLATLLVSGAVLAQDGLPAEPTLPVLPEAPEGMAAARFAIAGPVRPTDRRLTLITAERSCGAFFDDQQRLAAHVAENTTDIVVRIDIAVMDDGTICRGERQIRIPIDLSEPLGERLVHDAGLDDSLLPPVNRVDGIDTGFRYSCGGPAVPIVELLGPGLRRSPQAPVPGIAGARLISDTGDRMEFIGALSENGSAMSEFWSFDGTRWQGWEDGTCRPVVELSPGHHAATWSLRGPRPGPRTRLLRINVQGQQCHGSPPVGQITRPIIQVRKDSIVIILGTFFRPNLLPFDLLPADTDAAFMPVDCNGYGPAPTTVRLPVALGKRTLYDGGVFPPRMRGKRR